MGSCFCEVLSDSIRPFWHVVVYDYYSHLFADCPVSLGIMQYNTIILVLTNYELNQDKTKAFRNTTGDFRKRYSGGRLTCQLFLKINFLTSWIV
jgi:hypothetical protein